MIPTSDPANHVDVLRAVARHAVERPEHPAHIWRDEQLTWSELESRSNALARALRDELGDQPGPVVVLGHKSGWMLVSFLACVKSGRAYVPVDTSLPLGRVHDIIEAAGTPLLLAVEAMPGLDDVTIASWTQDRIVGAVAQHSDEALDESCWVGQDDPYYIIFTSGSTGKPKGVQISRAALGNFAAWALGLRHTDGVISGPDADAVLINQAPFSFDLSVFELAMSLASGATMVSIDKRMIARIGELFETLRASGATTWVSTPSFADLCLTDASFGRELMPQLELMLFCGETLTPETVRRLHERFEGVQVLNTYGPTESTVAVTSVLVDDAVLSAHPVLPIGRPRPGTTIHLLDPEGQPVPDGTAGEIVIAGDTVSLGYHARPDLTAKAFTTIDGWPAYRTGDAGTRHGDLLFFGGRLDFQVKLHGYRIELEDIEANLRALDRVGHAVVLPIQQGEGGAISHLHAVVQLNERVPGSDLAQLSAVKKELKKLLPDYMVPKTFSFVDAIPLTANGKVDRNAAKALV